MADIFLSYTEEDRETAHRLADALQQVGWTVWWDRRIRSGHSWRDVIEAELAAMRCMVVLWSRHSVDSDWVCEEAEEGRKRNVLVPVLIDPVEPPLGFRWIQAADLNGWHGEPGYPGLQQLVADLDTVLKKTQQEISAAAVAITAPGAARSATNGGAPARSLRLVTALSVAIVALAVGVVLATLWQDRQVTKTAIESIPPSMQAPPARPATSSTDPSAASAVESLVKPAVESLVKPSPNDSPVLPFNEALANRPGEPRAAPAGDSPVAPPAPANRPAPRGEVRAGASRCSDILSRQALGEQASAEDLAYLAKEC